MQIRSLEEMLELVLEALPENSGLLRDSDGEYIIVQYELEEDVAMGIDCPQVSQYIEENVIAQGESIWDCLSDFEKQFMC